MFEKSDQQKLLMFSHKYAYESCRLKYKKVPQRL